MRFIFGFLAAATGIYSLIIFIRIVFSWMRGIVSPKVIDFLNKLTDPYINWWRSKLNLRIGFLDFSVVAAITSLYLLQNIFNMLYVTGRITIGNFLAIVLISAWSVISFILGFCIIIFILRGIARFTNRNIFSPFWSAVESVAQPLMFRLNRLLFAGNTPGFMKGLIISILLLAAIMITGRLLISFIAGFLSRLPF